MTQPSNPPIPIHTSLIPMRWGEMDAYGHLNNTYYFRYAEQARVDWLDLHNIPCGPQSGSGPVLINTSCTFRLPLTYPATVEVKVFVEEVGRSSFTTRFEMRPVGDERLHAEGFAKIVWIDTNTGKSMALPDPVRALVGLPPTALPQGATT